MEPQKQCLGDHFTTLGNHFTTVYGCVCVFMVDLFGCTHFILLGFLRNCLCFHHHKLTHFILEEIVIVTPFILYHITI